MTPVRKIEKFIEDAMAKNDQSVYDLLQYVRQVRLEENEYLLEIHTKSSAEDISYLIADINEFLNTHLDALAIVTTYQKETEYLLGFQQALKMFRNEFEFILNTSKPIDTDETI